MGGVKRALTVAETTMAMTMSSWCLCPDLGTPADNLTPTQRGGERELLAQSGGTEGVVPGADVIINKHS